MKFSRPTLIAVLTLLTLSNIGCGGGTNSDPIANNDNPNAFTLTFADNFDTCGAPTATDISVTLVGENDEVDVVEVVHSGFEQSFSIEPRSLGKKSIVIESERGNFFIGAVDPGRDLYFYMYEDNLNDCGCTEYNGVLGAYEDLYFNGFKSWGGDSEADFTLNVCPEMESSAFVVSAPYQHASKLNFLSDTQTINATLFDVDSIPFTASSDSTSVTRWYGNVDSDSSLDYIAELDGGETTSVFIPRHPILTDIKLETRKDATYASFSMEATEGFFAGLVNFARDTIFEFGLYTGSITSFDLDFEFSELDIEEFHFAIDTDTITLSSQSPLPFDMMHINSFGGWQVSLPIVSGTIDLSVANNYVEPLNIGGRAFLLFEEYENVDAYNSVLSAKYSKFVSNNISRTRVVVLALAKIN